MPRAVWPLEPHTAAKHAILRRYLDAWFPKLAWTGAVLFVDGFAGPGEYLGGEPGSPQVALEAALHHTARIERCELKFLFIEADQQRFEHLNRGLARLTLPRHVKVEAVLGGFDSEMAAQLDDLAAAGRRLSPCLVMVDPFGPKGMPLDTLARISAQPRSELLISLMYEPINRFRGTPEFEPHLNELYGTPDWRKAEALPSAIERRAFLHKLYVEQLQKVAGMEYVSSFELRDAGNKVEYYLIHATHSIEGLKAIKAAMWKVDATGSFRFSDATVGRGPTLFDLGPDFGELRRLILNRFRGKRGIPVASVETFVLVETAFRETHYKTQVLKPLESAGMIRVRVVGGATRRKGTFPPTVILDFEP